MNIHPQILQAKVAKTNFEIMRYLDVKLDKWNAVHSSYSGKFAVCEVEVKFSRKSRIKEEIYIKTVLVT